MPHEEDTHRAIVSAAREDAFSLIYSNRFTLNAFKIIGKIEIVKYNF